MTLGHEGGGRLEVIEVVETTAKRRVAKAFDRELRQVVSVTSEIVGSRDPAALLEGLRHLIDLPRARSLSPLLDTYLDGDRIVVESPWVEGVDLLTLLRASGTPGLPVTAVLGWLDEVGDAVRHLQQHDLRHGDIRPANLVLNSEQRIVLVGLGSAVLNGVADLNRVDIRGVAVTAAALLTGTSPTVGAITGTAQVSGSALQRALLPALDDHSPSTVSIDHLLDGLRQELNAALPTGVVTFLLTDIVGSTRQWERDEASMAAQLARHDLVIGEAVEAAGGRLLKARGEGDATFSVFTRASAGVLAAVHAQERLRTETDVVVRMAIHTGEAELREADYFGRTVNRAARLRSVAPEGGILVSAATADLVIDVMPEGFALVDRGSMVLKDLDRAEHVYQIVGSGLAEIESSVVPLVDPEPQREPAEALDPVHAQGVAGSVSSSSPPSGAHHQGAGTTGPVGRSRSGRATVAIALVAALAVAAVGALALRGGGDPDPVVAGSDETSTSAASTDREVPLADLLLRAEDLPPDATDRRPLALDDGDEPCGQRSVDLRVKPIERAGFAAGDEAGRFSITELLRRYGDPASAQRAHDLVAESFTCSSVSIADASGRTAEGTIGAMEPMAGTRATSASYTTLAFDGLTVGLAIAVFDRYQVVVQYASPDLAPAVLVDRVRSLLSAALGHIQPQSA